MRLVGVRGAGLVEATTQLDMLDVNQEKEARLERTVDVLREKFGFDAVRTGRTFSRPHQDFSHGP